MKIEELKKMHHQAPFRPFQIHLTSGEVLAVEHPENMSMPEDEKELFVIWSNRDWNLIEAAQVARVSVRRQSSRSAR
jgi:hypothetical protein